MKGAADVVILANSFPRSEIPSKFAWSLLILTNSSPAHMAFIKVGGHDTPRLYLAKAVGRSNIACSTLHTDRKHQM